MQSLRVLLVVVALAASVPVYADSTWVDHYRAGLAAHAAGDIAGFRDQLRVAARIVGDTPGIDYNLACAAARLGDRAEALRRLEWFAKSGLVRDAAADSDLVSLWRDPAFMRLAARIRANGDSVGDARERHRFSDSALLTEDLAYDPVTRALFATSGHRGVVVEIAADGSERVFGDPSLRGFSLFGACIDAPRRLLWTTAAATPTADGYAAADSGRTALVAWDLATRRLAKRIEWPRDRRDRVLGDLTVGPDGTVYASDSPAGALRVVVLGADTMATLVPDGGLRGPQTPALAPDGRRLYVPEWGRGIAIVDLATGAVTWMAFARGIALQGLDGLYVVPGSSRGATQLVAVQNGTRPHRVVRLRLDAAGTRVVSLAVIESSTHRLGEPTHGVFAGDRFCFLANTGWDRVGDDQRLAEGPAAPPAILETRAGGGTYRAHDTSGAGR